jgi:hypothetical protein
MGRASSPALQRSPAVCARLSSERADDVGPDPAAVVIARLRRSHDAPDRCTVDAPGVERPVVGEGGLRLARVRVAPAGLTRHSIADDDVQVGSRALPFAE